MLLECTTRDIERLTQEINQMSLKMQNLQIDTVKVLSDRDQVIVIIASLAQLSGASERAAKRSLTPKFVRSIKTAYTVKRKFGTGALDQGKS